MRCLPINLVENVLKIVKMPFFSSAHLVTACDVANVLLSSAPIITSNAPTLLKQLIVFF